MPTNFISSPCEIDPRRWQQCMRLAAESMIAEGRHPKTLCPTVKLKRARRLWAQGKGGQG